MASETPVEDATRDELERLGALGTVEGQVALRLSRQLDEPRAGMAVAPDAKELRTVLEIIRDRAPVKKADPIDELNARRAARESTSEAV